MNLQRSNALSPMNLEFNKNEDHNRQLLAQLQKNLARIKQGGGPDRIERHHKKGKLTARERIEYLTDKKPAIPGDRGICRG